LATIVLCEAYGMSHDKRLERPARAALHFIETGQDQQTGGWWYHHRQPGGDTSVVGWQCMALKSGMMAGLLPPVATRASTWRRNGSMRWARGLPRASFLPARPRAYRHHDRRGLALHAIPGGPPSDPRIVEGTRFLMAHLPSAPATTYYWYYGTQVMHNQPGPDWDKWNRQQRTVLIKTQCGDTGCANGSWDPVKGMPHGRHKGGRLMMTSLGALTMEVYYRYLPLYKQMEAGGNALADLHVLTAALAGASRRQAGRREAGPRAKLETGQEPSPMPRG
jgi:hypothetical protein